MRGIAFPRIHDLVALRALLPEPEQAAFEPAALAVLSTWAAAGRYPGDLPDATRAEAEGALATARSVVATAELAIQAEASRLDGRALPELDEPPLLL